VWGGQFHQLCLQNALSKESSIETIDEIWFAYVELILVVFFFFGLKPYLVYY
jgi:hypothetical protein